MTVEIYKSRKHPQQLQPWYVRLKAGNGEIVAVSEGYFSKWNATRAARKNFPGLPIEHVQQ